MAKTQKYGIKYPFSNENDDNLYIDVNTTYTDMVKSKVLHVLFTPKGQKIRDPKFGTNLIKYMFEPSDDSTFNDIKSTIRDDIESQVPEVKFNDISVEEDPTSENGRIVFVHYTIDGSNEITTTAIKI